MAYTSKKCSFCWCLCSLLTGGSSSLTIKVDGWEYAVNIMEDINESLKLNPVLACNDFYNVSPGRNNGGDWRYNVDDQGFCISSEDEEDDYSPEYSPVSLRSYRPTEEAVVGTAAEESHVGNSFTHPEACENSADINVDGRLVSLEETHASVEGVHDETHAGTDPQSLQKQVAANGRIEPNKSLDLNRAPSGQITSGMDSHDTTDEVASTMRVGEMLGFRINGMEEQIRKMVAKRGVNIIPR